MAGGTAGVYCPHIATMTGHAGSCRQTGLQVRNAGGVTKVTIAAMGHIDCRIGSGTGIMAACTLAGQSDQVVAGVIDAAMSCRLVGMTIETGDRTARRYNTNDSWCRAVVTGGTGAGAVGGDVMLGAINLRPVRHDMADATRRTVRQISCAQCHSVTMRMAVEVVRRMTLRTVASGCCWSIGCCVMAAGTVVMFLDVRCVGKRSSNSDIMTTSTFSLQRDCGRMILAYMGGKVTCYSSMALAAIASR